MASELIGAYFVRATLGAFREAKSLFPRIGDFFEIRRQAIKLRYFPTGVSAERGQKVVDLNWDWIKSLAGLRVGELRIDDVIGGMNNLRIIFFVAPESDKFPKPCIWVLSVFQKKSMDFTSTQIKAFRLKRLLVLERFYQ
jgi:hypothetical protein